jgi:hypothetical protein
VLVLGSDWGLELAHSLSTTGLREQVVRLLDDATRERLQQAESESYWSIQLLAEDPAKAAVQTADL